MKFRDEKLLSTLKGIELQTIAFAFCVLSFIAGNMTFTRIFPQLDFLPQALLDIRLPLILACIVLTSAILVNKYKQGTLKALLRLRAMWPFYLLISFALAYAFLPFALLSAWDIFFAMINLMLFILLYKTEFRNIFVILFSILSSIFIAIGIVTTESGAALTFLGSTKAFSQLLIVTTFFLLFYARTLPGYLLLLLHGYALIALNQFSTYAGICLIVLLFPLLIILRKIPTKQSMTCLLMLIFGVSFGVLNYHSSINEKILFRLKSNETAPTLTVVSSKENTLTEINEAFPGGLRETEVTRDGLLYKINTPDFEKDTRVCIDDRSDRMKLFSQALLLYKQSPSPWGWGDQAFEMPLTRYNVINYHKHPHNIFLEILITRGVYFLITFLVVLYVFAIKVVYASCLDVQLIPFAMGVIYILVTSLWSGDFFDFRWFFMLSVPLLWAAGRKTTSKSTP